jgi:hypothetical protein
MNEEYVLTVLRAFERAECNDLLLWHVVDDDVRFAAMCNDVFWWATADAEDITVDDLPLLESCLADLKAFSAEIYLPELYCARRRRMRPQGAWYATLRDADLTRIFDACGPEREVDILNPGGRR